MKLRTFDIDSLHDGYDLPRDDYPKALTSKTADFAEYGDYCYFEEVFPVIEDLKKQLAEKDARIAELEEEVEELDNELKNW